MKLTVNTIKVAMLALFALFALAYSVSPIEAAEGDITGVTVRRTNVHTGPSTDYNVIDSIPAGTKVALIGRNQDETMLFVRGMNGDAYEGWILRWNVDDIETNVEPSRAVTVLEVMGTVLPGGFQNGGQTSSPAPAPVAEPTTAPAPVAEEEAVVAEPTTAPAPVAEPTTAPAPTVNPEASTSCGTAGAAGSAMSVRWTHVYNAADHRARKTDSLAPNVSLTPTARDASGCWVFVTFEGGSGWLPTNAINNTAILGLPVR